MSFDLAKTLQSKREFRQCLAGSPIEEELVILDTPRAFDPRRCRPEEQVNTVREEALPGALREVFLAASQFAEDGGCSDSQLPTKLGSTRSPRVSPQILASSGKQLQNDSRRRALARLIAYD